MQLIINGTDTLSHLMAARHVIDELIAERTKNVHVPPFPPVTQPPTIVINEAAAPPSPAPEPVKPKKPRVVKTVSADEVRSVMIEKSKAGHDAAIRTMLKEQFNVDRLSQVPPAELPALKAMVEAL